MLELEHGFRIFDVGARLDWDTGGDAERGWAVGPDRLEREMHQAGVVRAVVTPVSASAESGYLRANNTVARLSVDRPFVAFARIDGPRDPHDHPVATLRNLTASRQDANASPADVEQYAYDDRFHGFVLDPVRDGLPDGETLDTLADVELPVLVRGGPEFPPAAVTETLLDRSVTVVLSGFGAPSDRDVVESAIDLLDEYDHLYLDTAHVRYRDVLEGTLQEYPDRVLFGSGAPDVHPNVGVMQLLTLDVPEDLMRRAFTKNPARVIPALESYRQS